MSQTEHSGQSPILTLLRKLEWGVRHAADSMIEGGYRSAFRGRGMEFDQVVKYEFGDDFRDIDWNVTARLGEPYRKKFIEEREVTLTLLFEDSPSLQFGSGQRQKRDALMELAGLLGLLCAINRDRFSIFYVSPEGHKFQEPVRGRNPILHACTRLFSHTAPADGLMPEIPWKRLLHAAPKHSLLLWLGDFPPRENTDFWPALSRRYQVMGFRVDDPWERHLPENISFTAYDPISQSTGILDASNAGQRRAHAEWVARREMAWERLFPNPHNRMSFLTSAPTLESLVSFFRKRSGVKI